MLRTQDGKLFVIYYYSNITALTKVSCWYSAVQVKTSVQRNF